MLKLGIDATPLEEPHNGIGRYTSQIIKELYRQTDWQLYLLSRRKIGVVPERCHLIEVPSRLGSNSLGYYLAAAKISRYLELDCFFSPRHQIPIGLDIPSVITIHDVAWKEVPNTMRPLNYTMERLLFPRAVEGATSLITVSNHTQNLLLRYFPNSAHKLTRIYEAAFSTSNPNMKRMVPERYILAVGTREPRKNYDRLIKAFKQGLVSKEPYKLVIAGGPGWGTKVPQLIAKLQIEQHVQLLEGVSDHQLNNLYAHCEFLAIPSIYEGFGLPVVEAMAHGKAILCSVDSATAEIAGRAAMTVDPLNTESIGRGLSELAGNHSRRQDLEFQARQRSLEFSWTSSGQETVRVIGEASGKN